MPSIIPTLFSTKQGLLVGNVAPLKDQGLKRLILSSRLSSYEVGGVIASSYQKRWQDESNRMKSTYYVDGNDLSVSNAPIDIVIRLKRDREREREPLDR